MAMTWDQLNPATITGFDGSQPGGGSGGVTPGVAAAEGTRAGPTAPLWSPDNPLFWFAVLLVAAGGFFHLSTRVKAGPVKDSLSL
jgi:hypothetical protein